MYETTFQALETFLFAVCFGIGWFFSNTQRKRETFHAGKNIVRAHLKQSTHHCHCKLFCKFFLRGYRGTCEVHLCLDLNSMKPFHNELRGKWLKAQKISAGSGGDTYTYSYSYYYSGSYHTCCETGGSINNGPSCVDSIAFSVFVVILVDFDKTRDQQACLIMSPDGIIDQTFHIGNLLRANWDLVGCVVG